MIKERLTVGFLQCTVDGAIGEAERLMNLSNRMSCGAVIQSQLETALDDLISDLNKKTIVRSKSECINPMHECDCRCGQGGNCRYTAETHYLGRGNK